MRISEVYSGEPAAIGMARRTTVAFLEKTLGEVPGDIAAHAQLVVSELVTNAVRHAPGQCGLHLEVVADEVAITVWDTMAGTVAAAGRDPSRIGGHGLEIVAFVCGGHEVTSTRTGKQITARLPLHTTK
ncbi:ATP-binding protein [Streptomyces microflavus]|uniref:ATP-binding protein n=1 Tax=Streptomyces griseus group TaxID=629295 RepID=UPI00332BBF02